MVTVDEEQVLHTAKLTQFNCIKPKIYKLLTPKYNSLYTVQHCIQCALAYHIFVKVGVHRSNIFVKVGVHRSNILKHSVPYLCEGRGTQV